MKALVCWLVGHLRIRVIDGLEYRGPYGAFEVTDYHFECDRCGRWTKP
jgi:hypothetical protein